MATEKKSEPSSRYKGGILTNREEKQFYLTKGEKDSITIQIIGSG